MTRRLKCNPAGPENKILEEVTSALTAGRAVVIPTETQYALSLRADDPEVMNRINQIKRRDRTRKPALFVKNLEMAESFCRVSDLARKLADRFLPGPLTMILPGRGGQMAVSPELKSNLGFGIRISSSPLIKGIMARVPFAVTATSANISGETTAPTIEEISWSLGDEVSLYVDGGPCRTVTPSTVLHVDDRIEILRHGLIAESEIKRFLGGVNANE